MNSNIYFQCDQTDLVGKVWEPLGLWCNLSFCVYHSWTHCTSNWYKPQSSHHSPSSQNPWARPAGWVCRRGPTGSEVSSSQWLCINVSVLGACLTPPSLPLVRSCGCIESCVSDLGSSNWFQQRYDPMQQPVIRNTNTIIDPDALRWWLVRTI